MLPLKNAIYEVIEKSEKGRGYNIFCVSTLLPNNILGRNLKGQADIPCRINVVPRPIPDKKWFLEPWFIVLVSGFLPFGSIFIEMYFIFTSFWAYKIYYVYGFMFLVTVILMVVTACVTIVSTYFLLNAEDYRWRWCSFLSGSSVSLYVYLYSIYYFIFKTKMYGLFQTVFYFGYMALFSIALGALCGTVGYISTATFIHKIYSRINSDYVGHCLSLMFQDCISTFQCFIYSLHRVNFCDWNSDMTGCTNKIRTCD